MTDDNNQLWSLWWESRIAEMERILGPCDDLVGHSLVPFEFGFENGGGADMVYFRHHVPGVVAATCELIGCDELGSPAQVPNELGNYELIVCHRDESGWGSDILSKLAYYTLDAELNPGETLDLDGSTPEGSTIAAFLFVEYARFEVRRRRAGLLACIGITSDELKVCRKGKRENVEAALRKKQVFPYTDLFRESVLE